MSSKGTRPSESRQIDAECLSLVGACPSVSFHFAFRLYCGHARITTAKRMPVSAGARALGYEPDIIDKPSPCARLDEQNVYSDARRNAGYIGTKVAVLRLHWAREQHLRHHAAVEEHLGAKGIIRIVVTGGMEFKAIAASTFDLGQCLPQFGRVIYPCRCSKVCRKAQSMHVLGFFSNISRNVPARWLISTIPIVKRSVGH